ncbi:MAG TPA: 30S ribosome-binding factor RbfA [Candidatus Micrarchaeia archaeon]|nr:30S ribosome-binding factor RbfA [Candidatus Micrarchaeia archaeon]
MSAPSDGSSDRPASHRLERVNAQLRVELARCLLEDVKDPRVAMTTVIRVACSPDLGQATVRVSVLAEDPQRRETVARLERLQGFIRHQLGTRVTTLRRIPRLRFVLDDSIAYAVHISQVLERLPRPGPERPGPEAGRS